MLSEGRSKPVYRPKLYTLALVGVFYLAVLGAYVTVRAIVGWV